MRLEEIKDSQLLETMNDALDEHPIIAGIAKNALENSPDDDTLRITMMKNLGNLYRQLEKFLKEKQSTIMEIK